MNDSAVSEDMEESLDTSPKIDMVKVTDPLTLENIKITKVPEGKAEGVIAFKNAYDGQGNVFTKIFYAPFVGQGDEATATVKKSQLNGQKYFDFNGDNKELHKKVATAAISRKIRQIDKTGTTDYPLDANDLVFYKQEDGTEGPSTLTMQNLAGGYRKRKGKTMKKRKSTRHLKLKKHRK